MKKYISTLILLTFIIPSIVMASWWNPLTWFNNWDFKKESKKEQIIQSSKFGISSFSKNKKEKQDTNSIERTDTIAINDINIYDGFHGNVARGTSNPDEKPIPLSNWVSYSSKAEKFSTKFPKKPNCSNFLVPANALTSTKDKSNNIIIKEPIKAFDCTTLDTDKSHYYISVYHFPQDLKIESEKDFLQKVINNQLSLYDNKKIVRSESGLFNGYTFLDLTFNDSGVYDRKVLIFRDKNIYSISFPIFTEDNVQSASYFMKSFSFID